MYTDFLRDAQRIENLHIKVPREALIQDFDVHFVSFGSCFAQNLKKFIEPYGLKFWYCREICAHYSPLSIAEMLTRVVDKEPHVEEDLYFHGGSREDVGAWRYYKMRGRGPNAVEKLFKKMKSLDETCYANIQDCSHIIITLGTCRQIRSKKNNRVMCCMDGIPLSEGYFVTVSVEDNVAALESVYNSIKKIRGDNMPIMLFTISPQRYLFRMDGGDQFLDNYLGKCILRVALDQFLRNHADERLYYFPSLEIVLEELRHFESLSIYDHCHINQDGTPKYVVKRFLQTYCSDELLKHFPVIEEARDVMAEVNSYMEAGVPFNSSQISSHLENFLKKMKEVIGPPNPAIVRCMFECLLKLELHQLLVDYLDSPCLHATEHLKVCVSLAMLGRLTEAKQKLLTTIPLLKKAGFDDSIFQENCSNLLQLFNSQSTMTTAVRP